LHYTWKRPKDKSALHATSLPAKQNTIPVRSNMGHTHPCNLEQSCQGANYYKQPISVRKYKTRPITSGNLEFQNTGTIPFVKPPTERLLPKMAKICRLPKNSRNTVINASIDDTTNNTVKKMDLSLLELECATFNPTKSPQ
jgi:hypothetical protein